MQSVIRVLAVLALCYAVPCLPQGTSVNGAVQGALPEEVNELVITELKPGTGETITSGQTAVVQYTGWLYDPDAPDGKGTKFDSSRDRGTPFKFPLGAGKVIRGWDQGVAGMQVGGERRLLIPAELGYGDRGAGGVIPPGATLVFDVELVDVE